jgi:hypothetical protein
MRGRWSIVSDGATSSESAPDAIEVRRIEAIGAFRRAVRGLSGDDERQRLGAGQICASGVLVLGMAWPTVTGGCAAEI